LMQNLPFSENQQVKMVSFMVQKDIRTLMDFLFWGLLGHSKPTASSKDHFWHMTNKIDRNSG